MAILSEKAQEEVVAAARETSISEMLRVQGVYTEERLREMSNSELARIHEAVIGKLAEYDGCEYVSPLGVLGLEEEKTKEAKDEEPKTGRQKERGMTPEKVFEEYKIDWTPPEKVRLSDISKDITLQQVRNVVLDDDLVESYAEAMKGGDAFPPIVLARLGKQRKLERIDGNHRIAAAERAGLKFVDAYVIQAPEPILVVCKIALNRGHGQRPTKEENRAYGDYLVEAWSMSVEEAARSVGITVGQLSSYRSKRRARERLENAGVSARIVNSMTTEIQECVSLVPGEAVVKEFAVLVDDGQLNNAQVRQIAKSLKALPTERARLQSLEEARDNYREQIQIKPLMRGKKVTSRDSDAHKLARGIGLVMSVSNSKVRLSAVDRDALAVKCRETSDRLTEIAEYLEEAHRVSTASA